MLVTAHEMTPSVDEGEQAKSSCVVEQGPKHSDEGCDRIQLSKVVAY
jgi:hypothetical protein